MRHFARIIALALSLALAALPARAEEAGAAVQGVIRDQIAAFLADDIGRAFGFATPDLRRHFGTAERFGAMVRQGYPMVWRPGALAFLGLEGAGDTRRQIVEITDRAGRSYLLEYSMVATEEGWRIDAVRLLPAPPPMT